MGFWSWVGRATRLDNVPEHTFDAGESAPQPIDQLFLSLASKVRVTRDNALSVATVQRGRNLLCSISSLPVVQIDGANRRIRNPLLEQTDPNVPNVVNMAQTVEDLVFDAIAWWRVTERAADGYPMSARRLDPNTVSVDPPAGRTPAPLPSGSDPRDGVVYVDGKPVPFRDVIRFDSPNPGVLKVGLRAIQRAIMLDKTAALYAEDPQALEYFTARDGMDPEDDGEIEQFLSDWRSSRRSRTSGYVPWQYERHDVSAPSPVELQLVEIIKEVRLDLANAFGLDPEDLGVSTTSRSYANIIDRRRDRINDVLAPYMRAITDRLSMGDVTIRGRRVIFDLDDYMKSNPTERWATYRQGFDMGVWDAEEIRERETLPPRTRPIEPPAASGDTGEDSNVTTLPTAAARAAANRFDQDQDGTQTFAFTAATASSDAGRRQITGLAVPYGVVANRFGIKLRFTKGSLQWADPSRVKHYMDHVTPIGRALTLTESDAGLLATLSVAPGAEGDRLLELANPDVGVYDGLSVGVDFSYDPEEGDIVLNEDDGVYDVVRADLREISSTPMPQFDDARTTRVAASRSNGGTMNTGTPTGQAAAGAPTQTAAGATTAPPAAPAAPVQLTDEQRTQFSELARLLGLNVDAPQVAAAGPTVVDPTTLSTTTQVREPAPYRFDRKGNLLPGAHDFSTDLHAAYLGDAASRERATSFVRAQFDVATGDVNELNPTRQRPDMYVDQRSYRYPMWEAISKGTLGDITPFVFPKFNSASGLVANHTEGVEPGSGTLTTTSQTVTPTAVSGKAKITREAWDQGGSPQLSGLIWRQMEKGWYEALEAYAASILDAASPTQITLTTAAVDDALVDELTGELIDLQFIRGGFSMDTGFGQVDLYKRLAMAEDSTGRSLLPALNPMNANGTVRGRWAGLDLNGVSFLPAWALAASGSVAASSYLFDRDVVWGWASTPQRLDFNIEVAHVYIGLWGYKAGAITDITGVREIVYDPTA